MNIREIKEITSDNKKILTLNYGDRKFALKMENIEQLNMWKNALMILKTFCNDDDSPLRKVSQGVGKSNWKMKNIDQETLKAIINEKESKLIWSLFVF